MPRKQRPAKRQEESSFLTPDFLRKQKLFLEAKLSDCQNLQKVAREDIKLPTIDERSGDLLEQALTYGKKQIAARQLEECAKITSQVIWALQSVNNLLDGKKSRRGEEEYGKCVDCRGQIPERRLIVVPWARKCVPCQQREDAKRMGNR